MFYYLLIVNKNGSLIYDRAFTDTLKLSSNEFINIASIFYSMHAISSKLTPPSQEKTSELKLENGGIEVLQANEMKLVCYQTLTKLKFIFVTDKTTQLSQCEDNFKKIYNIYCDWFVREDTYPDLSLTVHIAIDSHTSSLNLSAIEPFGVKSLYAE